LLGMTRRKKERVQLNVGRQCKLAPNIGLEEFWGLHTLELVRPIPAEAGLVRGCCSWFLANS
jgi:hypothetical protein